MPVSAAYQGDEFPTIFLLYPAVPKEFRSGRNAAKELLGPLGAPEAEGLQWTFLESSADNFPSGIALFASYPDGDTTRNLAGWGYEANASAYGKDCE